MQIVPLPFSFQFLNFETRAHCRTKGSLPNRICGNAVLMHLPSVGAHGLLRRNANVALQSWSRLEHHIRDVFASSIDCCRCVNGKKVNWQRTWRPGFADAAGIGCYTSTVPPRAEPRDAQEGKMNPMNSCCSTIGT